MTARKSKPRGKRTERMWAILNYDRLMDVGSHRTALIVEIFGGLKEWRTQKRLGHVTCQRCTVSWTPPHPRSKRRK